jgi:tetratricopeptide (TPR) repeat protein
MRYSQLPGVKPKEAAEAYFRAGVIQGKRGDFTKMVKVMRDFPSKYGSVAGQKEKAVEAFYRIAKAAEKRGSWKMAKSYFKKTVDEYARRRLPPAGDAAEYAAESQFKLLEKEHDTFLKRQLKKLPLSRVVKGEKTLSKAAVGLKNKYGQILKYKRARWSLATLFRYGTIYEHVAKVVAEGYRTSPVPRKVKRLGQDAVDIYRGQIDEALAKRVGPLEKEAKKLFENCINKAKELGVSNKYSQEAEQRLNALDPDAYPLLKPPAVETVIE